MIFLFNDELNTFYLRLLKDNSDSERGNPLSPLHGLEAMNLVYAPSHKQDSTYLSLGALAGKRNTSMGPP